MWTLGITNFQRKQKEFPITLGKQSMRAFSQISKSLLKKTCTASKKYISQPYLKPQKDENVLDQSIR